MSNPLTAQDYSDMIQHELSTPPNGYLGSNYGNDLKQLLQTPMNSSLADSVIDKLVSDVPVLQVLPQGSLYIGIQNVSGSFDSKRLVLSLNGSIMALGDVGNQTVPNTTA